MDVSEFYETFFEEADELLVDMEAQLLEIDLDAPDAEQLNAIFRAAHSIKGGAGTFGFTVLQETTHLFENLLDNARQGELQLTREIVDTFLETKDMLKEQLEAYRSGTAPDQENFEKICAMLQAIAGGEGQAPPAVPAVEPESQDLPAGVELFGEAASSLRISLKGISDRDRAELLEELARLGDIGNLQSSEDACSLELCTRESPEDIRAVLCFVIDDSQLVIEGPESAPPAPDTANPAAAEQPAPPTAETPENDPAAPAPATASKTPPPSAKGRARAGGENASIRVSVDKVDQVINLVGELIITQSMLNETISSLDPATQSHLVDGINSLQRNARDLQESVMSIRMLPMDYVFSRFPRLVRDLAGKLGKEIDLVTEGESTELDKGLTERIIDPLTHLVRNSLDHGIELPDEREAKGKPRVGCLTLSAQHQGGNILIEVRDDGGGLSRERILSKARASGITVSDTMPDDEVWQLIFAPGFSTAEQVSDLSGRGVGMDVVKRNIQSMGGHVEIFSREGEGTTTRIVLPLTLAILDGMLVKVGEEVYIVPVSSIVESLQLQPDSRSSLPGNIPMLCVRGEYYPLVSVGTVMGVASEGSQERPIAVMVQGGSTTYVLVVDELLGQQQVVVKNLESNYRKVEGVSAATILGDGSVALILDIPDLYRLADARRIAGNALHRARQLPENAGEDGAQGDTKDAVQDVDN